MDKRPSDMYQDMKKLNMLYEEMCWDNDDIIEFYPDYDSNTIIIRNKTMDEEMISGQYVRIYSTSYRTFRIRAKKNAC